MAKKTKVLFEGYSQNTREDIQTACGIIHRNPGISRDLLAARMGTSVRRVRFLCAASEGRLLSAPGLAGIYSGENLAIRRQAVRALRSQAMKMLKRADELDQLK